MYKLLIVDDEPIIRSGLKNTIDWKSMGFEVVGEAENGGRALEMVRQLSPHLVLADIKMPLMDGLSLLKEIKKYNSQIKVVLLSGREEFEYAREGMLFGAEGYILKLSIERDLSPVFEKVKEELEFEEREKNELVALKADRKELFYESFLRRAINGEMDGEDIKTFVDATEELPLDAGCFCVVCLHMEIPEETGSEMAISQKKKHMDHLLQSIDFNVEPYHELMLIQPGNNFIITYYSKNVKSGEMYNKVLAKWYDFQRHYSGANMEADGWRISVGIGEEGQGWVSIYPSYVQARKAALFKAANVSVAVTEWTKVKEYSSRQIISVKEENELLQSIVMGDRNFVLQQLNYLFTGLENVAGMINAQDIQTFFIELLILIKWKLRELEIDSEMVREPGIDEYRSILSESILERLVKRVRERVLSITGVCYKVRRQPAEISVMKVARYLENHFSEKILLEEMANYVYMSPSYFSTLFKQYTGKSFTDYLLDIRMAKAKKLLEERLQVGEVAERIGYQDIRHFSKTYKKYFGVNPSEVL